MHAHFSSYNHTPSVRAESDTVWVDLTKGLVSENHTIKIGMTGEEARKLASMLNLAADELLLQQLDQPVPEIPD